MRWFQAGVVVLSTLALAGCPSEFGKDGRVGKAVHKDTQEHLLYITGCSEARKREVCEGPLKDPAECAKCK
jgi:hypothetical protein